MTGGVGQRDLARFNAHHFIPKLPADTKLVPISRTVGADRIVDESIKIDQEHPKAHLGKKRS